MPVYIAPDKTFRYRSSTLSNPSTTSIRSSLRSQPSSRTHPKNVPFSWKHLLVRGAIDLASLSIIVVVAGGLVMNYSENKSVGKIMGLDRWGKKPKGSEKIMSDNPGVVKYKRSAS
jgi:hypothetical protein